MTWQLYRHDARRVSEIIAPESVDAIICSPPYFALRSYRDECEACSGGGRIDVFVAGGASDASRRPTRTVRRGTRRMTTEPPFDSCPHVPPCRGLFSECVTAWLQGPPIGTPESLRLGRLMHQAIHPTPYCYLHGCRP